jgi:hypothetical protein
MPGISNRFGPANNEVNFYSNVRLQFSPKKADQKDLDDLKEAIMNLNCPDGQILVADLTSSDDGSGYDAENILFYNVGSGPFSKIAKAGIRFKRHLEDPRQGKYHHRYHFKAISETSLKTPLMAFEFSLSKLNSSTKAAEVWWAAAEGVIRANMAVSEPFSAFEMGIDITAPNGSIHNLTGIIKALLDGTISSLHFDQNVDDERIQELVAALKNKDANVHQVKPKITDTRNRILGQRDNLIGTKKLIWNPADDRLQRCTLLVHSGITKEFTIKVQIGKA